MAILSARARAALLLPALLAPAMPAVGAQAAAAAPGAAAVRPALQPQPQPQSQPQPQPPQPAPAAPASATAWTLGDAFWDRPRSAEAVRLHPAVRSAVAALAGTPKASLVIRHGRGQNDGLRAEELRHWLVALAVEPGRIAIAPAGTAPPEGLQPGDMVLELAR